MSGDVCVIGAGPAGLTAAYLLAKAGVPTAVIERDPRYVGGISRTENYKGYLFDIGGHRFFSKSKEVVDLWNEILPDDFIERPRLRASIIKGNSFPIRSRRSKLSTTSVISRPPTACCPFSTGRPFRTRTRRRFTSGCPINSGSGCSRSSSRPTPKRSGECRAMRSRRTGPRSESKASTFGAPWQTLCGVPLRPLRDQRATARRSRPSSRAFDIRARVRE
jgi:uncharacterized protein with NAD-binding domain and iron-sulfur cluster